MRILVAGGSGAIARPLLPLLVAAGHEVHATTRRSDRAALISGSGATAEVSDLLEHGAADQLLKRVRPQVVIDELTSLPQAFDPRKAKRAYAANDRIRREGSGALIAAAEATGVSRYIVQSVAFIYRPSDGGLRSEQDPLWTDAPAPFDASVGVLQRNEQRVTGSEAMEGTALRYGFLYGPGTWYATGGSTYEAVAKRRYPLIGGGEGVNSLVHVADAASATLAALEGSPGIYNVVDDDPAPFNVLIPEFARMIGAKSPRNVPAWLGRLAVGKYLVAAATTLAGADNARIKQELGWRPAVSSWREGLARYRDSDPPL